MQQIIRDIYSHLGDEESKKIYVNRLLFSMTGDRKYMTDIIKDTELYKNVSNKFENDKRKKYIVSAGQWGKIIVDLFWEFGISGIIDNYVAGSYRGLPILSVKDFSEREKDATVYIASTSFHEEFIQNLKEAGVREDTIVDVTGMMLEVYHNLQYFDLPFLDDKRKKYEVFVDGGCYDGENSLMFAKWADSAKKMIYAFEPDKDNVKNCERILEQIGKDGVSYQLIQKGLWSSNKVLKFSADSNEGSRLAEDGAVHVPVTSLDSVMNHEVTFIKMDIEGAEYEALTGAKRLIQKYKPKLAISVYHKIEDIWELPQLILSMQADYTFYLRHYSLSSEETVLYAI